MEIATAGLYEPVRKNRCRMRGRTRGRMSPVMITQQPARNEMVVGAESVVAVAAIASGEGETAMFKDGR